MLVGARHGESYPIPGDRKISDAVPLRFIGPILYGRSSAGGRSHYLNSLLTIDNSQLTMWWKKGRVSRKPGSVVKGCGATLDGGYLSGTPVTRRLKRFFHAELVKDQPWFLRPCTQPGFTEPAPLDAAGALLPHLCTLTIMAVCFCGTILTIARTGRYPASLVFREPGLSSDRLQESICNRLPYSSLALYISILAQSSLKAEVFSNQPRRQKK